MPPEEVMSNYRTQLIIFQHDDPLLSKLLDLAKAEQKDTSVCYYEVRNDVFVRCARDRISPVDLEVTQMVVPYQLHDKLLQISHDLPTSGHLGAQKTFNHLARHFFWVGMRKSVVNYCRTCDTCQHLGKANVQSQAPLTNLPVIGEVFSKLAVDIVGPLKTCQSGNRFILTVIDFTSHYPLAYPLKSHTTMNVVKCLVEVFSHYGFPDELLSDCGTEFFSQITQAFLVECHLGQIKTSPYHPQSNGCLERFRRMLKSMLKGCGE